MVNQGIVLFQTAALFRSTAEGQSAKPLLRVQLTARDAAKATVFLACLLPIAVVGWHALQVRP